MREHLTFLRGAAFMGLGNFEAIQFNTLATRRTFQPPFTTRELSIHGVEKTDETGPCWP